MSAPIEIILPSFLRRTLKAYALKAEIRAVGCDLNRIGRSRNWQLKGSHQQLLAIIEFIHSHDEKSWYWLAEKLSGQVKSNTTENLLLIAKQKPGITVNELMAKTDCTIAQARKIIDQLEWED